VTGIEPLENRIAPATLLTDYRTLIYLNADGELVNVKFSSPVFSAADAQTRANAVFDFDTGGVTVASAFTNIDGPQQLQLLDLTALKDVNPNPAEGVSITISTTKMDGRTAGTSFADVGFLKAVNPAKSMALALGAVSIQGDLGRIEAGNANTAVAIKSLTVQSMGAHGLETQAAGGSLVSQITGGIGALVIGTSKVSGDFKHATLNVNSASPKAVGSIASITIYGNVVGKADSGFASDSTGLIRAAASIGTVAVRGKIQGGGGSFSGAIDAGTTMGAVSVTGDVIGGAGDFSGLVAARAGKIAGVTLGGSLTGGAGSDSGKIFASTELTSIKITGSVSGGAGQNSGSVQVGSGFMGAVTVLRDVIGGAGFNSGGILCSAAMGAVSIAGSVVGGDGELSGRVAAQKIASFALVKRTEGTALVGGSLLGGNGINSGRVTALADIGTVSIKGSVIGGDGTDSGALQAGGSVGAVSIDGSLNGGTGERSGVIVAAGGKITSLTIGGSVTAGAQATQFSVTADLADAGSADTITRTDGGNWLAQGIRAGSRILVRDVTAGATGGSEYVVAAAAAPVTVTISSLTAASGETIVSGFTSVAGLSVGVSVAGTGIAEGTRITAVNTDAKTVTLSTPTTDAFSSGTFTTGSRLTLTNAASLSALSAHTLEVTEFSSVSGGNVFAGTDLGAVTVKGSVTATAANTAVFKCNGNAGVFTVQGSISGGGGDYGATLQIGGKLGGLVIGGSLVGGAGQGSGSVFSGMNAGLVGDMGAVKVGLSIEGGIGGGSGAISSTGKIASLSVGSAVAASVSNPVALRGGSGDNSGTIFAGADLGAVLLVGSVQGGAQMHSGSIVCDGRTTSVEIRGNLVGGAGEYSGSVLSRDTLRRGLDLPGNLGQVTITGFLKGGTGGSSGAIEAEGNLTGVKIVDSVSRVSSPGSLSGSIRSGTGSVASGNCGPIVVGSPSGTQVGTVTGARIEIGGKLASFYAKGAVSSTILRVADDLGSFSAGALLDHSLVSARGQAVPGASVDLAIGSFTILGNVSESRILAGYDLLGFATNADAQIGAVKVTGNWTASDLVAGVEDADGDGFGDEDDRLITASNNAKIVAQIASVLISGTVSGTEAGGDRFGFVAQKFGSFSVGTPAVAQVLTGVTTLAPDTVRRTVVL